jgi:hypothetical protein
VGGRGGRLQPKIEVIPWPVGTTHPVRVCGVRPGSTRSIAHRIGRPLHREDRSIRLGVLYSVALHPRRWRLDYPGRAAPMHRQTWSGRDCAGGSGKWGVRGWAGAGGRTKVSGRHSQARHPLSRFSGLPKVPGPVASASAHQRCSSRTCPVHAMALACSCPFAVRIAAPLHHSWPLTSSSPLPGASDLWPRHLTMGD